MAKSVACVCYDSLLVVNSSTIYGGVAPSFQVLVRYCCSVSFNMQRYKIDPVDKKDKSILAIGKKRYLSICKSRWK